MCKWYHEEILGWHQSYLLFKKRHLEISDKSKYPDNDVHLMHRGNKSENPNKSPGIYLTADKKLKIYVNTVIDIDNSENN